jgi:hypothetical protein
MMVIVGVDNSITCPAVVKFELDDGLNIKKKTYFSWVSAKKEANDNLEYMIPAKKFLGDEDRFEFITNKMIDFISGADFMSIEDYAFGATGKVFNLGEITGLLKNKALKCGIHLRKYGPKEVKKFATGNGNAGKLQMERTFLKDNADSVLNGEPDMDISQLPMNAKDPLLYKDHPFEDIADAYYITRMLYLELKLRKGLIMLRELPDYQIELFNRVTKNRPENILTGDFTKMADSRLDTTNGDS